MTGDLVTVYCQRFSVPGSVIERGITGTVRISYHPPGEPRPRSEWFYDLDVATRRRGERMGDQDVPPLRYSQRRSGLIPGRTDTPALIKAEWQEFFDHSDLMASDVHEFPPPRPRCIL